MEKTAVTTEEKIVQAAMDVFVNKGYDGARMQEIADRAEINKAMLHYYFRNKEKLFKVVFEKKFGHLFRQILAQLQSNRESRKAVAGAASDQLDFLLTNRKIPLFLLNTLSRHPDLVKDVISSVEAPQVFKIFAGRVSEMKGLEDEAARHWLISFLSLRLMPIVGEELFRHILQMTDEDYNRFLLKQNDYMLKLLM